MSDTPTTPLHIMQFERIRKNLHDIFVDIEGAGVSCVKEYQELLDDVRSIESSLRRYMEVNHEQSGIITDLTNQNCELKHEQD